MRSTPPTSSTPPTHHTSPAPTLPGGTRRQLDAMAHAVTVFADCHAAGQRFVERGIICKARVIAGFAAMRFGRWVIGGKVNAGRSVTHIDPCGIPDDEAELDRLYMRTEAELQSLMRPAIRAACEGVDAVEKHGSHELREAVVQACCNFSAMHLAQLFGPVAQTLAQIMSKGNGSREGRG